MELGDELLLVVVVVVDIPPRESEFAIGVHGEDEADLV
jgi:hypothetical protein